MNTLILILLALAGLYAVCGIFLFVFQRTLLYRPDALRYAPGAGLPQVQEVELRSPDGETLIAWYGAPAGNSPTFLYFHGNGGGLMDRRDRLQRILASGYGVLIPSYRGYSGSTGRATETALIADGKLAYDYLRGRGLNPQDIIIYGESLGTAVAAQVAAVSASAAVILEAPFTSAVDVGKKVYRIFPVQYLMFDRFESINYIKQINAPLLVVHGAKDEVIPLELGRALFEAASEPKEMAILPGAGHADLYMHGAWTRIQSFLENHLAQSDEPRLRKAH